MNKELILKHIKRAEQFTEKETEQIEKLIWHKAMNWGKECKFILKDNQFFCNKCNKVIT